MTKWKNTIKIKHTFVEYPTNEDILASCNTLISQLNRIKKVPRYLECEFEDIKGNFGIIRDCCNGKDHIEDYCWDDDTVLDWFNNTLEDLYDIADQDKFIWIE